MPEMTITFPAWWLDLGLLLGAVALATALVVLIAPRIAEKPKPEGWLHDLVRGARMPTRTIPVLLWLILPLFILAYVGALFGLALSLWSTVQANVSGDPTGSTSSLGFGALMVAILGSPFLIWRTMVAQRTANQADEVLFNTKFHAAASDLAARRKVTTRVTLNEEENVERLEVLAEEEDDVVARTIAVEQLAFLVKERPIEAQRVANILAKYVAEVSRSQDPAPCPVLLIDADRPVEEVIQNNKAVREWAQTIRPRPDCEIAVQTLGGLQALANKETPPEANKDNSEVSFSLANCNLQGMSLSNLRFRDVSLANSYLDGANLDSSTIENCDLIRTSMRGMSINNTAVNRCRFFASDLSATPVRDTKFHQSSVQEIDLRRVPYFHVVMSDFFGDSSVVLKEISVDGHVARPKHWHEERLDSRSFKDAYHRWRAQREV